MKKIVLQKTEKIALITTGIFWLCLLCFFLSVNIDFSEKSNQKTEKVSVFDISLSKKNNAPASVLTEDVSSCVEDSSLYSKKDNSVKENKKMDIVQKEESLFTEENHQNEKSLSGVKKLFDNAENMFSSCVNALKVDEEVLKRKEFLSKIDEYVRSNLYYPEIARQRCFEGEVVVFVSIENKYLKECFIKKSSGYKVLDRNAEKLILDFFEETQGELKENFSFSAFILIKYELN